MSICKCGHSEEDHEQNRFFSGVACTHFGCRCEEFEETKRQATKPPSESNEP